YADSGTTVSWGITQSVSSTDVLAFPSDIDSKITTYLEQRCVQVTNDLNQSVPASCLWNADRFGLMGCLIVVLVNGQQQSEFYDLIPRIDRRYPIVAVTTVGDYWWKPIQRALAQSLADLGDEFEMDGPDFEKPPTTDDLVAGYIPPNLIQI